MSAPEIYRDHAGTIRIAAHTDCTRAAKCALHYALNDRQPIDFLFLGANAAQQATKAMSCFADMMREATEGKKTVLFEPIHVLVETPEPKDATVFRAVISESPAR